MTVARWQSGGAGVQQDKLQSQAWLTTGKCMYSIELAVPDVGFQTLLLIAGKLSDMW